MNKGELSRLAYLTSFIVNYEASKKIYEIHKGTKLEDYYKKQMIRDEILCIYANKLLKDKSGN